MPVFKCDTCGAVDNTALTRYWMTAYKTDAAGQPLKKLCSACDPKIAKWHECFPRQDAVEVGYLLGNDGFLYHPEDIASGSLQWRLDNSDFTIVGPA